MAKEIRLTEEQLRRLVKSEQDDDGSVNLLSYFNLGHVSKEELERQHTDLSEVSKFIGYTGRFIREDADGITEEDAMATQTVDDTRDEIKRKFGLADWQFTTSNGSNGIQLVILYAKKGLNSMLIKRAMKACGWHLLREQDCMLSGKVWKCMSFDPMFQDNVSNEARKHGYLYHWTPVYRYESIKKHGLVPQKSTQGFKHPARTYLMKGNIDRQDIFALGRQLCASNTDKRNNGEYILLVIDLSLLPDTFELYLDPRYEYGYYTKETIPTTAITKSKKFNLRNTIASYEAIF